VRLLLLQRGVLNLGMGQHTNDGRMLGQLSNGFLGDGVRGILASRSIFSKGLLLALIPALVEATFDFVAQVVRPQVGQSAETTGGLDVANNTDDNHRGGVQDGNGLDSLFLVELGARLGHGTENVGHTSLVAHKGSQVGLLGRIIPWKRSDVTAVLLATLARQETERAVTRRFKLAVRHNCEKNKCSEQS